MSKTEWQRCHEEYLETPYWFRVKKAVWDRDEGRCRRCPISGRDVHHLHYRSYMRELDDLDCVILLCRKCHDKAHGKDDDVTPTTDELLRMIAKMGK